MSKTRIRPRHSPKRMIKSHGREVTTSDYQVMRFRCEWCRQVFERALPFGRGRHPKFCCNARRQTAFYWRLKEAYGVRYKARVNDMDRITD